MVKNYFRLKYKQYRAVLSKIIPPSPVIQKVYLFVLSLIAFLSFEFTLWGQENFSSLPSIPSMMSNNHVSCYSFLVSRDGIKPETHDTERSLPSVPIVVTLGPGTAFLEKPVIAPLDPSILRLNLSHVGEHQGKWGDLNGILRAVTNLNSALLADNPGPKIRIRNNDSFIIHPQMILKIHRGQITVEENHSQNIRNVVMPLGDFDWLTENLKIDDPIVIGDDILAKVIQLDRGSSFAVQINTVPKVGYLLTGNKGLQAPGVDVNAPALTEIDFKNADWILWTGSFQGITISFIRDGQDVIRLQEYMHKILTQIFPRIQSLSSLSELDEDLSELNILTKSFIKNVSFRAGFDQLDSYEQLEKIKEKILSHHGLVPMIWAKIETVTALKNLDFIMLELAKVNGGVIVARGDLVIQTARDLITAQMLIVYAAKKLGIPVVVATGGFATPSIQDTHTPSDAIDIGLSAMLQAGIMVSEQTAMALNSERLQKVIQQMIYVAHQSFFFNTQSKIGLAIELNDKQKQFVNISSSLTDPKWAVMAKGMITLSHSSHHSALGRAPIVFDFVPPLDLIRAIRSFDWSLPIILIVRSEDPNKLTQKDKDRSIFLQKMLRFYPFLKTITVTHETVGIPTTTLSQLQWVIKEGDSFISVRQSDRTHLNGERMLEVQTNTLIPTTVHAAKEVNPY